MSYYNDRISELLNNIKIYSSKNKLSLLCIYSNIRLNIVKLLFFNNFVKFYKVIEYDKKKFILIFLKYFDKNKPVFNGFKRISKPGLKVYSGYKEFFPVKNNAGLLVVSTSKGIMTGQEAKKLKIGGEVLFSVW